MYRLTGRVRYRVTRWRQRLVIQVQEAPPNADMIRWRDATTDDLFELGDEITIERPRLSVVK